MPDIRIKDLTTTASSTASDDFFAADGTTNGTRKLSAYSPTFGGNATVGGTLTVNSSSIVNGSASGATSYLQIKNNGSSIGLLGSRNAIDGGTATDVGLYVYGANALTLWTNSSVVATFASNGNTTLAGALSVSSTTASTSTSSGALVVGNGTSGGLGVGGAIFCGSLNATADSKISSAAAKTSSADTLKIATATGGSSDFELLIGRSAAGSGAYYSIQSVEQATGYRGLVLQKDGGNVLIGGTTDISGNGGLKVFGTTDSNATNTGALVVSGGLGVAKAIYAGGDVFVVKADPSSTLTRTANTNSALFQLTTGATYDFAFGLRNTTDSDFHLYNYGTSSDALTIARASSNATFAGTVIANASSNAFRITTAQTPASASATGTAGAIAWDTSYIYVCTATNTWKRVALSTW